MGFMLTEQVDKSIQTDSNLFEDKKNLGPIKIAMIDSSLRESFGNLFASEVDFEIVEEVQSIVVPDAVDVFLIKLGTTPRETNHFIKEYVKSFPSVKVVILTDFDDASTVIQSVSTGIRGYLLKEMDFTSIVEAIRIIVDGGAIIHPKVTKYVIDSFVDLKIQSETFVKPTHILLNRECDVLQMMAEGKTNDEIADALGIAKATALNHVVRVLRKMNANNRTDAVVIAIKNNWVKIDWN